MKRRYAAGRTKKRVLFELELETLEKLERIQKEQMYASRKKERMKAIAVNPFMAMMYKKMSFNVWRDVYGKISLLLNRGKPSKAVKTHLARPRARHI